MEDVRKDPVGEPVAMDRAVERISSHVTVMVFYQRWMQGVYCESIVLL